MQTAAAAAVLARAAAEEKTVAAEEIARAGGGAAPAGEQENGGNDESGSDSDGEDRGVPPPHAPPVAEINRLIEERNHARKQNDFREADRIRDYLKGKGVVLSDEKGGSGKAQTVTSWRYWRD